MSFDPVAHDTLGLRMDCDRLTAEKDMTATMALTAPWLANSAGLGLGTNDPENMELVEASLG
jgi:hypothetical protein